MSQNIIEDEPIIEDETDDDEDINDDDEEEDTLDEEEGEGDDEEDVDDDEGEVEEEDGKTDEDDNTLKPAMLTRNIFGSDDEDDDEEDELNENYLQKLDSDVKQNIIAEYHPELNAHNIEEVETLCMIIRDARGQIIDPLHRTIPFVTRYEKARVIGERAKQINSGAPPFIEIEQNMIDGYLIALKEFENKKIPFIIRRPLPNGASEYWRLSDLEIIA